MSTLWTLGYGPEGYEQGLDPKHGAYLDIKDMRRHTVLCGASGSGKTVALKAVLAQLAERRVPTVAIDVKGDLAGVADPLEPDDVRELAEQRNLPLPEPKGLPTLLWSLGGLGEGAPFVLSPHNLGPDYFSTLCGIDSATQRSVVRALFAKHETELVDLDTVIRKLRSASVFGIIDGSTFPKATVRATLYRIEDLQRSLGDAFGPPTVSLEALMTTSATHVIAGQALQQQRLYYAALVGWLMQQCLDLIDSKELRMVLVMDEASTLFDASDPSDKRVLRSLSDTYDEACRKLRSKGIGLVWVSQAVTDFPDYVLENAATSVQLPVTLNGLKAAQTAKRIAATFEGGPIDAMSVLVNLQPGQALVKAPNIPNAVVVDVLPPCCSVHALHPSSSVADESARWHAESFGERVDPNPPREPLSAVPRTPPPPPPPTSTEEQLPAPTHKPGQFAASVASSSGRATRGSQRRSGVFDGMASGLAMDLALRSAHSAVRSAGRKMIPF